MTFTQLPDAFTKKQSNLNSSYANTMLSMMCFQTKDTEHFPAFLLSNQIQPPKYTN